MLEVFGEDVAGKLGRSPDDEGGSILVPRDDVVNGRVIDQLKGLREEGRRQYPVPFVWRRRLPLRRR